MKSSGRQNSFWPEMHGGDAASRAYYAAFHAVSAVLLSKGITLSSHSKVLGSFNKEFVHTGFFPHEFTTILTRLFEDRQMGDYDFTPGVTKEEANQDIEDAVKIVEEVKKFLKIEQ